MTNINFHQKVVILNDKNELLALLASYKGLRWDLPGGAVELPELHEDALRREVAEEAGIEIGNIVPVEVETGYNSDEDCYVIFIGYQCRYAGGKIRLSDEHSQYKWMTQDEFLAMNAIPYLKDLVRKWAKPANRGRLAAERDREG